MYSAYAPLLKSKSSQRLLRSLRQKKQTPQDAEFAGITREPTSRVSGTSEPTCSTPPASPCPKTAGGAIIPPRYPRFQTCRSVPQATGTLTRTYASPEASGGISIFQHLCPQL